MAVTPKVLVPSKVMENTQQQQYTALNVTSIIDKCTVTNTSANNVVFSLNIVADGGTASDANILIKNRAIAPNQSYHCPEVVGHSMGVNSFISTIAGTASALTLRISGREIS